MSTENSIKTERLKISGMTCVNCALNLERSVKQAGIDQVHVNFANHELLFERPQDISDDKIQQAVKDAGFSIATENKSLYVLDQILFAFSLIVAFYFIIIMFLPINVPVWVDASLASLAMGIGYFKFGNGAYYSVKSGSANMYVLILLGATTALLFSLYLVFFQEPQHLYFETTAVLIALVLIGDILEANAVKKTVRSIQDLSANHLSLAKRVNNGEVEEVSTNSLKIGDIVQAFTGDEIATDAKVIKGEALIDESLLTGESTPVRKAKGMMLLGGSKVLDGNLEYEVLKNAHLSTKAKMDNLVRKASGEKANVQKLADKISGIFVPLVLILTVFSFLINYLLLNVGVEDSILRSVAVLVISCPCAMGLATPIAVMVGIGKMTSEGILVKNPNTFENLAKAETLIYDKTGTLSTGNFRVKEIIFNGDNSEDIKQIIKALESKSSHPIARSVANFLDQTAKSDSLQETVEIKGQGMQGIGPNKEIYRLGSANFTEQKSETGDLFLTKDKHLLARIFIEDELKAHVNESLSYFKNAGLQQVVLSGDSKKKCQDLAAKLYTEVIAELKPEDKLNWISSRSNENLAMVGDGVNDAPSLAKVNVGISFAQASDLAIQSADVVIMRDDMHALIKAHRIAKQTYQTIKQNLFWAFAYNLVAIPLAALGIINPMLAAFAMIFSDLIVVGNAFRLKNSKILV